MKPVSIIIAGAVVRHWPALWADLKPHLKPKDEVLVVLPARLAATLSLPDHPAIQVLPLVQRTSVGVAWQAGVDRARLERVIFCPAHQPQAGAAIEALRQVELPHHGLVHGVAATQPEAETFLTWGVSQIADYATGQPCPDPLSGLIYTTTAALQHWGVQNEELGFAATVAAARGASVVSQVVSTTAPTQPDLLTTPSAPRGRAQRWAQRWDAMAVATTTAADFTLVMAWTLFKRNPLRGFGLPAFVLGTAALVLGFGGVLTLLAGAFAGGLWLTVGLLAVLALLLLVLAVGGELYKRQHWPAIPAYLLAPAAPALPPQPETIA